jgi:hypothetical protein
MIMRLAGICSITIMIVLGCVQDSEREQFPSTNLLGDRSEYQSLIETRSDPSVVKSDPFEIIDITKVGELLNICVRGGCSSHDYKLVWDGLIRESLPVQINLAVVLNSQSGCPSDGTHTISVNLHDFFQGKIESSEYEVLVSNASRIQDLVIDQHGVTSDSIDFQ